MKIAFATLVCASLCLLAACGAGLSGAYGPKDNSVEFAFKPGNQLELSAMGQTRVGTYKLQEGKVYITIGNETQAFAFDKHGCIDGGFIFGILCRK